MLNLVEKLKDERIHSISELSKELEVSPRMIRQYKTELEEAGIYISSTTGKYGGYQLEQERNTIDIGLTKRDIVILKTIKEQLKQDILEKEYEKIIERLESAYQKNDKKQDRKKLEILMEENKKSIEEKYIDIRKAINKREKVQIVYYSINSDITNRVIHPAELFQYKQEWYVAAFCELREEIRLFSLENILEYKILEEIYDKVVDIKK